MNINYTQQQLENDLKTANFIFNKYFSKYKFYKEDMIQECLLRLCSVQQTFKNDISSYRTYACKICFNCMSDFVRSNCNEKCITQSLSEPISDNLTIEDTLGEKMQINELGLDRVFKAIIHKVKRKLGDKSNSYLKFIKCKLNFMSNKEIEERLGCTRQFVCKLNKQLRADIVSYSKKFGIEKEISYYANN